MFKVASKIYDAQAAFTLDKCWKVKRLYFKFVFPRRQQLGTEILPSLEDRSGSDAEEIKQEFHPEGVRKR